MTLIEILVVIAILVVVVPTLYLSFSKYRANRALETSAEAFADSLRTAHVFSREAKNESAWGVRGEANGSYEIVFGKPADWQVDKRLVLNSPATFENAFFIWFVVGTGAKDKDNSDPGDQSVSLVSPGGRLIRVAVADTGVVEVSNE
ncbi:hypothetical protein A3D84_04365 [Candidatus Woesebacteria bacterium RIFCSPHIGHO2_02_FULL_42_20]|nr:MAG: hypothetical protein A2W15_02235 [Candidatus Woesebacteria bacterium RBG_16_41_13]OGM30465.1 MAG: hypothetical protein A2873_02045 [Candidatus Woesebacteria bacterium RIFCSPHIGHO2_01_FULL_42_80]OGM34217.1 MAG: hypothetical protein A3D84_04365 [Candidatus Woesebacteria bacterium RIFCSPHIGHO2_02_FULL_42_20]OGM68036.1 MAG: hypothetical protein A2969_02790 [Candidatus Woesebacteria bacterium RIFCSPLOWO2_01_FULL_42_67]OGM70030.1 MAG: hypothetical protein A3I55_04830 [Candidatus Woesebacteria